MEMQRERVWGRVSMFASHQTGMCDCACNFFIEFKSLIYSTFNCIQELAMQIHVEQVALGMVPSDVQPAAAPAVSTSNLAVSNSAMAQLGSELPNVSSTFSVRISAPAEVATAPSASAAGSSASSPRSSSEQRTHRSQLSAARTSNEVAPSTLPKATSAAKTDGSVSLSNSAEAPQNRVRFTQSATNTAELKRNTTLAPVALVKTGRPESKMMLDDMKAEEVLQSLTSSRSPPDY